ncbi:hypothetical protein Tco_0429197 [Tanacetum coccineum]
MDVKTEYINGDLEDGIYMNQPEGFIAPGQESKVCTRSDLAYVVSMLSRLHYDRCHAVIERYSDANWISNIKDSRSTSEYVFTLRGAAISWKSFKQTIIVKSIMESEFFQFSINAVRGGMLRVISIDYAKLMDNIAYPLTKGLSRELVGKSSKGIGLKPLKEWVSMNENLTQLTRDPNHRNVVEVTLMWGSYLNCNEYSQKDKNKAKTTQNRARD